MKDTDTIFIPFDSNGNAYSRRNRMPLVFEDSYHAKQRGFDPDCLVEYAPIRHGYWIERDRKTWCSECIQSNKDYKPRYCPHCGASMTINGGEIE